MLISGVYEICCFFLTCDCLRPSNPLAVKELNMGSRCLRGWPCCQKTEAKGLGGRLPPDKGQDGLMVSSYSMFLYNKYIYGHLHATSAFCSAPEMYIHNQYVSCSWR